VNTTGTVASDRSEGDSSWARLKDFYDLTKPRMNAVVIVTTLAGYYLAARDSIDSSRLVLTLLGTALAAAGASVLNQVMEREFDALMPRTANRPLPSGRIRTPDAFLFGLALAIVGVALLAIDVNILTAALGALTLITYLLVYTPAKRRTTLCTLFGAVPGAIPVTMGFSAATGRITPTAIALFLILFTWQIPHFLAIAILYCDDYAKGGFQILPATQEDFDVTARQILIYCLALLPVTLFPVVLGTAGPRYVIAAIILNAMFTWCGIDLIRSRRPRRRQHARRLFLASLAYILCLLPLMILDHP
jgi:protoheme IX farnesyltransferase